MTVIVVTNVDLGWDCVVGVFDNEQSLLNSDLNEDYNSKSYVDLKSKMSEEAYVFHEVALESYKNSINEGEAK